MNHQYGRIIVQLPDGGVRQFLPAQPLITLGRASTNDIVLNDGKASRTHARLEFVDGAWSVVDLQSTNGVEVNGERVERATLQEGDQAMLGDSVLRVDFDEPISAGRTMLIDSEADLDATLVNPTLSVAVRDISTPRLAVFTPQHSWEVPLLKESVQIGRSEDNDIDLLMPNVSRHHVRIERRGDNFVIRDLGSTNGTWLYGQRIDEHILQNGDTIRIGDAQLIFKGGSLEELTLADKTAGTSARPRQPVIFLPGIMGSELWLGNERVWPNVRQLFSNPEIFSLPEAHPLEPRDILREFVVVPNLIELEQYDTLSRYLREELGYQPGVDLLEFSYDWRQPLEQTALRLAQAVDEWKVEPPYTIVAHSMGSLISRYYVEKLGGKHKIRRLIFMGGPHQGSPKALTNLVTGPNLLPFGLLGDRLRRIIATFPSAYHLLPAYHCIYDQAGMPLEILDNPTWLPEIQRPLIQAAREFRHKLGMQSSVSTVCIFGYDIDTITRVAVQQDIGGSWGNLQLVLETDGDGTVPQNSTILPGADVHPVAQTHGALYVDNDVKMRLKIELTGR